MLRITVHDHPPALTFQLEGSLAGPWLRVLEECWQGTLAHRSEPMRPRRLDGGDLHRRRGPGLPGGHAPPGGRIHRPRLPDESRRGRDHPDTRSRLRASEVTGSSRDRPTERGNINMGSTVHEHSDDAIEARPTPAGAAPAETRDDSRPPPADATAHPDHRAADPATDPTSATSRLRPGRHRTPGGGGCCGRGPWPAWRSEVTPWRRPSRRCWRRSPPTTPTSTAT